MGCLYPLEHRTSTPLNATQLHEKERRNKCNSVLRYIECCNVLLLYTASRIERIRDEFTVLNQYKTWTRWVGELTRSTLEERMRWDKCAKRDWALPTNWTERQPASKWSDAVDANARFSCRSCSAVFYRLRNQDIWLNSIITPQPLSHFSRETHWVLHSGNCSFSVGVRPVRHIYRRWV